MISPDPARAPPTAHMLSRGGMVRLTPSSTRAGPASVANETKRFSTSRILASGRGTADPRIEGVAQAVAQQIKTHHHQEDRKPGRESVPPRFGQELARLGNQDRKSV